MSKPRFERAFQAILAAYTLVFAAVLVFKPNGETGLTYFSDIALSGATIAAGVAAVMFAWNMRGADRRNWLAISLGVLSWGLGIGVWSYYELVLKQDPYPSLADVGYLGMIPLVLAGLVFMPAPTQSKEARIKVGLDAIVIMTGIATISWFAVLGPMYSQSEVPWAEKLIGIAYPFGDVLLMCALVGGFARGWITRQNPVLLPLFAGIVLFIVADMGFAYLTIHDAYASGQPIDLGWGLGFLLIAYATFQRWTHGEPALEAQAERTVLNPWMDKARLAAPYALVFVVAGLVFFSRFNERGGQWNVFLALGLITVLLVVVRQFVTLAENERLNEGLRSLSHRLEAMVEERTARLTALHELASALSAASSSAEVSRIGLTSLRSTARASEATLLVRTGAGYEPAASDPPTQRRRMRRSPAAIKGIGVDSVVTKVERDGTTTAWVPLSERGQLRGVIALTNAESVLEHDLQTLVAIGAEFGVAHENQRRFEQARELADRDAITGLFNPRYLHTSLDELIEVAARDQSELALVLMDIDDFKLFNDTYGHQAGDEVLRIVAQGIRELCVTPAFAARFGGDEFAVVIPNCGRDATIEFVHKMQEWANTQAFQQEGGERIPIRLSFGFGVFPEAGTKRYEVVAAADSNLYESKRSGAGLATKERDERRDALRKSGTFTFLEALVTSVDNKDQYTKRHCDLVSEYALVVAEGMGLSDDVQRSLVIAGALHDVGKICIPDRILRKPSGLTPEEYETIKLHVPLAANLIQHVPRRKDVLDGVLHHHERFDGTGYMKGLKGLEIPLLGRIMSVADAFSAMTLDRTYRKALPFDHALQEIMKGAGTQFDPEIAEIFIAEMERRFGGIEKAA